MSKQNPLSRALGLICISAILSPVLVIAQHTGITTQKLREQIALMEKIDQAEDTSDEVRALNRTLLAERKAQLAVRLVKELNGLKKYSQTMAGSLSESETQRVLSLLEALQRELNGLQGNDNTSVRDATGTTNSSPREPTTTTSAPPSNNFVIPGTEAPRNTANHASTSPLNSTPQLVAACFPDAPDELVRTAQTAATAFIDNRDTTGLFGDLMFFTASHTVAIDANREDLLKALEIKQLQEQTRRTDKQVGSPPSAAGSTSLAEKPGLAEILGFAIEHGAIQKAVSGTTLNLSTTPYAFTTLNGGDTQSNYKKYGYLTRLGISADFNIQNQDNPLGSARRSQLADWSLRLRLSKDRSTRSDDVEKIWDDISAEFARPSIVITDMLRSTFQSDVELEAQRRLIVDRLIGVTAQPSVVAIRNSNVTREQKIAQVTEKFICQAKADIADGIRSGSFRISEDSKARIIRVTLPAYEQARNAKAAALKLFDERIEALSYKPIFTLAYNNVRPALGTNYSELKMLYQKKTGEPVSLIANAGLSLYHRPNTVLRQQTVRDFAATLSFEGTAGRSPFLLESKDESQITYSFSGRYQRIFENRFFAGRKADIALAQFKFNLPMFSGMSFPFSVTYANASELIKEKHVRANFGFSFDTDKLLKALALSRLPTP